jgi:hypothetical protein
LSKVKRRVPEEIDHVGLAKHIGCIAVVRTWIRDKHFTVIHMTIADLYYDGACQHLFTNWAL